SSPSQLTSATRWPKPASAKATAGAQPPKRPGGSTLPSNFDVRPGTGGALSCQANVIAASPATRTSTASAMRILVAEPSDGRLKVDHLADVALDVLERGLVQMRAVGANRAAGDDGFEAVRERVLNGRPDADVGLDAGDDHPLDVLLLQEQGEVGGEERGEAPLWDDDLSSRSSKPGYG